MMNKPWSPERIYIEQESLDYSLSQKILNRLKDVPVEIVSDLAALYQRFSMFSDPLKEGKKCLLICRGRGDFVKPCPCTPVYLGCRYTVINLDLNCPLDCSYCILQQYLTNPLVTVHVNTEDLWRELEAFLQKQKGRMFRIGTGELGDSLALDHITGRSRELISFFRKYPNAIFELKTKTLHISHLLEIKPPDNVVIAWSLNAGTIARSEEKSAPPVHERIEAAYKVALVGYRVAFHFDPLIYFSGWEKEYSEVVEKLLSRIPVDKIAWISLGSLRFPPSLKEIIARRFPESNILYQEFIRGLDGKIRYFKPLRIRLYTHLVKALLDGGKRKIPLYLCMESKDIWRDVLKKEPEDEGEVEKYLSSSSGCCQYTI